MTEISNLELDVDLSGRETGKPLVRIAVGSVCSFTRHGGAPVVTANCASPRALEREVERLKDELDAALAEAREQFGQAAPAPPAPSPEAETAAPPPAARLSDENLRVQDVMTRDVRTVHPNDALAAADELMRVGHFRHAIVVDDDGVLVGVLSHRDLFHGALAFSLGQGRKAHEAALAQVLVKDVMHGEVENVEPETPLHEAAARMRERKIGCLAVLDGAQLVGIVTEGDFLALLAEAATP